MDVDIDRFWSNGCGYVPVSEQWIWKNGYTAVVVRMAGYTAGIGHVYILLIGPTGPHNEASSLYNVPSYALALVSSAASELGFKPTCFSVAISFW